MTLEELREKLDNREYWQKRFEQIEDELNSKAENFMLSADEIYQKALKQLISEMMIYYEDPKRPMKPAEVKEFQSTIGDYIEKGIILGFSASFLQKLRKFEQKKRLNRIDAMLLTIENTVETLATQKASKITEFLKKNYEEAYYKSVYEIQKVTGFKKIGKLDDIDTVMNRRWQETTFSEKIWGDYRGDLIEKLKKNLKQNIVLGKKPDEMINDLSKAFNVDKNKAATLVYTERAYFQSQAQLRAFNELGVGHYEFVATLDSRTSEICREMDGKVFPLSEYEVGVNAPPLHPRCRSCISMVTDRRATERVARDLKTGKSIYIPNMTYKEWLEKYVERSE